MLMSWKTFAASATNPKFLSRPNVSSEGPNFILMISEEPERTWLPENRNRIRPKVSNYPGVGCEGSRSKTQMALS